MDGCCHDDNLRILLINRHKSYIVTADQTVSITINRACAHCDMDAQNTGKGRGG